MGQDNKEAENVPKMREFRKQTYGTMDLIIMVKEAGVMWRNMDETEKEPYRKQGKNVQRSLRRSAEDD